MGNAILTGQSGGSAPSVTNAYGYTLLADQTVTGSAVTTVTFSGLSVGVGDELLLVSDGYNPTGGTIQYYIYVNNNTTNANYYNQSLYAGSTTVGADRPNYPRYASIPTMGKNFSICNIKMTNNGFFVVQSNEHSGYSTPSSLYLENFYITSTFTITSITSLIISSTVSNGIGIGSRFWLYKINGKEAKTWVTT